MRIGILHHVSQRVLVVAIATAAMLAGAPAAAQQITLLHVNDTHSHVTAWGPKDTNLDGTLGGLPKLATIVAATRATNPGTLFVHSGDFMSGDLFFAEYHGVAELRLLEQLGLDAIALGNHEFQGGPAFLAGVLAATWPAGGGVPVLGTNLNLGGFPQLTTWITPTIIKQANGVNVGMLALTLRGPLSSVPSGFINSNFVAVAQAAVASLRASGAQVVVALTHFGMPNAHTLAASVPGIDVIVNGHDNAVLEEPEEIVHPGGGVTRIVSAGHHYEWVGRLRLFVDGETVNLVDYALVPVDASVAPDAAMQAAVEAYQAGIVAYWGDVYHQPIAWAEEDIAASWDPRKAKRDSPLGNLLTDAYRARTGTDIALHVMGFIDDPLPAGPIVAADLFRSMSYGPTVVPGSLTVRPWQLVTFRIAGKDLLTVLNATIKAGGNSFPQVSGLRLTYDSRLSVPVLADTVHVGGHRLVEDQLYSMTVTEYLYTALSNPPFNAPMRDVVVLPDLAFDAARELVQQRAILGLASSGRIRDVAAVGKPD